MEVLEGKNDAVLRSDGRLRHFVRRALYYLAIAVCLLSIFHSSLLVTSRNLTAEEIANVEGPIAVLEARGFDREVFILRNFTVFRASDNWLNAVVQKESAYAATNFPLNIVTLYPDYFRKASDDTERAMVLLHEVRHLQGGDEHDAYQYAWRNRRRLGWTILSHGTTETYISTEQSTREAVPELFSCSEQLWNDCTEIAKHPNLAQRR